MEIKSHESQHINIQLPQFPGYNTFNSHTQASCQSHDSLLDGDQLYNSYGSIYTDHTGRSLDTLDVLSCRAPPDERIHRDLPQCSVQLCKRKYLAEPEDMDIVETAECSTQVSIHTEMDNDEEEENIELAEINVNDSVGKCDN